MALVKDEWVIRKTSTGTIASANTTIRANLDIKQNDSKNKDINGKYIDNFFADLFDARDGSLYRIFSTGATNNATVIAGNAANGTDGYYTIVRTTEYITQADLEPFVETTDLSNYRVESEIVQIGDGRINAIKIDDVIIG